MIGETSYKVSVQRKNMLRVLGFPDYKKLTATPLQLRHAYWAMSFDAKVKEISSESPIFI
jgi:hypothetical protein